MRLDGRGSLCALLLVVVLAGCAGGASQPGASRNDSSQRADSPSSGGKKRASVAIRGYPTTLNAAINSAGPGGVAGVSELEVIVHAGLGDVDIRRVVGPRLAEELPSIDNGQWK